MEIAIVVTAAAAAAYEILSRVIPSSKTWSLIGNIINILKKISDELDKKK